MPANIYFPIGLIAALTALVASILGPFVTLTVARHQFKANVLSANRQRWIDTFRDRLAELLSVLNAAQVIKRASVDDWHGGAGPVKENPALLDRLEKAFMAVAQIQLLTKGAEPAHQALNDAISAALGYLQQDELWEADLSARTVEISGLGRTIIREEWGRVKRGV
jgi:hypothetical protein